MESIDVTDDLTISEGPDGRLKWSPGEMRRKFVVAEVKYQFTRYRKEVRRMRALWGRLRKEGE